MNTGDAWTPEEIETLRTIVENPAEFAVPSINPGDGYDELRRIVRKLQYNGFIALYDAFVIPGSGSMKRYTATLIGKRMAQSWPT